jgi:hypothetical protein
MPERKEPHFFAKDLGDYPLIKSPEAYAALFADATDRHRRIGEASVYYLRSSTAIPRILDFDPNAKLIAMLRNPVDIVHALHTQLLYVGEETVQDFETAWRLQGRRSRGLDLPPRCRDAFLFQYAQFGHLGSQIRTLLSLFPRAQVRLILFEDFTASPQRVYEEVLRFLDLPQDGRTEFSPVNESKRARITWVKDFLRKPPPGLRTALRTFKQAIGGDRLGRLKGGLVQLNTIKERRTPLRPAFRGELVETYRDEIALLSRLLSRDLTHWVQPQTKPRRLDEATRFHQGPPASAVATLEQVCEASGV